MECAVFILQAFIISSCILCLPFYSTFGAAVRSCPVTAGNMQEMYHFFNVILLLRWSKLSHQLDFFFYEHAPKSSVTLSWETLGWRQRWRIPDRKAQAVLQKHCVHSMQGANVFDPSFPKEVLPGDCRWMNQHVYKSSSSVTPFSYFHSFYLCFLSSRCPDTDTKQSLAELNILSGGFKLRWYHAFDSKIRNGYIVCTWKWWNKKQQKSLVASDVCSVNHLPFWMYSVSVLNLF